jgi:hypothetical protein
MATPADDDPRPRPPAEPDPDDCCRSACQVCIFDLYEEALERYRIALAAWQQRHPDDRSGDASSR